MMRRLAGAILALTSIAASGGEFRFQCPERYPAGPIELRGPSQPWHGAISTVTPELPVSSGGMISGSPKDYPPGELRGRESLKKDGASVTVFPVDPAGSWIYCAYGKGGDIRLFRRLEHSGLKTCTMTMSRPKWPAAAKVSVNCE